MVYLEKSKAVVDFTSQTVGAVIPPEFEIVFDGGVSAKEAVIVPPSITSAPVSTIIAAIIVS
jgi:hypothetical protein